jgi:hypothetical protein
MTDNQVFDLLACPDEIKHRHALGERHKKRRKQTKHNVRLQIGASLKRESKIDRDAKTHDGKKRSRQKSENHCTAILAEANAWGDRRVVRRPPKAVYRNDPEGGPDAKKTQILTKT